jgi:hypothetical protein
MAKQSKYCAKHMQGYSDGVLQKYDSGALALEREAKAKADALAASYAASRSGVKPEPIPKTPQTTLLRPPPKITPVSLMGMLSDAELAVRAAVSDTLPHDPTSLDYLRRAEAGDARREIFRRALSPSTGVRA